MPIRTILRGFGKSCITLGVLILLFVAYQLWGTGLAEQRSQERLRHQFASSSAPVAVEPTPTVTTATTLGSTTAGATTTTSAPTATVAPASAVAAAPEGSAIGILRIPSIGVNVALVEGVGVDDLKEGPGHYPRTPYPGQAGNAAIAGHRTTYGAPFYRLDELKAGDDLYVATKASPVPWHYQMVSAHDVDPTDVSVLDPSTDNILTLTTCTPRFTAEKRLIVVFRLLGAVDPHPVVTTPTSPAGPLPGDGQTARAPVGSLSGARSSTTPAIAWGLICALVWVGAWLVGRRIRRRYVVYALALPVFGVCLFIFFENFARLVPANI